MLTLWAAVVAQRLGFDRAEALTLGKAVAGLNAQSKGRRLGIFKPSKKSISDARKDRHEAEDFHVDLLGRMVPVRNVEEGIRALNKDRPIDPDSVERYLASKFGDDFDRARKAMEKLAGSFKPAELAEDAFALYEEFRPEIPGGKHGWGAKGELDLAHIRSMAR